jgi:hypothetical protein
MRKGLAARRRAPRARTPGRRLPWFAALLVALGAVALGPPAPATASIVTFEPSEGHPGSKISIPETICPYQQPGLDQVWFTDRLSFRGDAGRRVPLVRLSGDVPGAAVMPLAGEDGSEPSIP